MEGRRRGTPDDIRVLSDVKQAPVHVQTGPAGQLPGQDLHGNTEDAGPYHVSSGTTGKPTVVGYTANDLESWTYPWPGPLTSIGLTAGRGSRYPTATASSPEAWGSTTGGSGIGANRDSHERREHRAADRADAGPAGHGHLLHALLYAPHGRGAEKMGISLQKIPSSG